MLLVPLEHADWQLHRTPTRRISARPRLPVPKDTLRTKAVRKADCVVLRALAWWWAFEAPIGGEITAAQNMWQRQLKRPLGGLDPFPPFALWIPYSTTHRPVLPGYVLVLTDQLLTNPEQQQLQRALTGPLGGGPWRLNPSDDIPWAHVQPDSGWLSAPMIRPLLARYLPIPV